jgi:rubrerythrin
MEYLEAVGDPATGLPFGSSRLNLQAAIAGETHEYTDMYPGMAKTAREEGEPAFIASDCQLAGHHIEQGIREEDLGGAPLAHPLTLLRKAYDI